MKTIPLDEARMLEVLDLRGKNFALEAEKAMREWMAKIEDCRRQYAAAFSALAEKYEFNQDTAGIDYETGEVKE